MSTLEIVEFSKEFFVTEQGEVIKIGAMKTYEQEIIDKHNDDKKDKEPLYDPKRKKIKTGEIRENYISIFKVENDPKQLNQMNQSEGVQYSSFTAIIFHARDEDH